MTRDEEVAAIAAELSELVEKLRANIASLTEILVPGDDGKELALDHP